MTPSDTDTFLSIVRRAIFRLLSLLLKIVEGIVVFGYIVFEEVIWNTFAKPLYDFFKGLALLDALKQRFLTMHRLLLVSIFIVILVVTEVLGILSVLSIANEKLLLGVFIYTLKIPIAAFTFWLFKLTKATLMTFVWLKAAYEALIKLISIMTESAIYHTVKTKLHTARQNLRQLVVHILHNSAFAKHLRSLRALLKSSYAGLKTRLLQHLQS